VRSFTAFDTPPKLPFGREQHMLVEGVGRNGDFHPFTGVLDLLVSIMVALTGLTERLLSPMRMPGRACLRAIQDLSVGTLALIDNDNNAASSCFAILWSGRT
jgi:hypothetical protein